MATGIARIPEEVILRLGEVSKGAGRVYLYYCARRNRESGIWQCPVPKTAEALKLSPNRVYEARKELVVEGWIELLDDDYVRPLVGFMEVESSSDLVEPSTSEVESSSDLVEPSTDLVEPSTDLVEPSTDLVEPSTDLVEPSTSRIDKDRARVLTPHLPPTYHTHTAREGPADGAERVCVCGLTVSLELLRRFWRNQQPPPTNVEALVGKSFDGCYRHAQVREWLGRQSAPSAPAVPPQLDARNCPDCGGTGFLEPGGRGKGVKRCPHEGLYARMAEAVQARAHAPP